MAGSGSTRWGKSFGDAPTAPLAQVAALLSRQADKMPANVAVAACVGLMLQWTKPRRDAFAARREVPHTVHRAEYDAFVSLFGPEATALSRAATLLTSVRPPAPALPTIVVAPYYHGAMQRGESEELLKTAPPGSGAFLLRLASEPGAFAFSSVDPVPAGQRDRASHHILIKLDGGGQYYFPTLPHLRGALPEVISGGCREGRISVAVEPSFLHTLTALADTQRWMAHLEAQVLSTPIDIAALPPPAIPWHPPSALGPSAPFTTHHPPPMHGAADAYPVAGFPIHRAQTAPEEGGGGLPWATATVGSGAFGEAGSGDRAASHGTLDHGGVAARDERGEWGSGGSVAGRASTGGAGPTPAATWRVVSQPAAHGHGPVGADAPDPRASWHAHAVTAPAGLSDSGALTVSGDGVAGGRGGGGAGVL
jgi:hypothetical protein